MKRALTCGLLLFAGLALSSPSPAQEPTEQQKQAIAQAVRALDEAVAGIAEVEPLSSRLRAVAMAAEAYGRAGHGDRAREVIRGFLEALSNSGDTPRSIRDRAASDAVRTLSNLGFPSEAAEIATGIDVENGRWSAMAMVASGYVRSGETARALEIAASISENSSRDIAYQSVASGCIRQADFPCASGAVEAMTDSPRKVHMFGVVANAKARKGAEAAADMQQARDTAERLPDTDISPSVSSTYSACIPTKYQSPRDAALREVAESQIAAGDFAGARESLNGIRDPEVKENAVVTLARTVASKRDFTLAFSIAGEVTRPECRSVALSSIAFHQFLSGDSDGARLTVERIPAVHERVYALMNIGGTQRARRLGATASTLALASRVALQASDEAERFALLLEVARRQFGGGFRDQARSTLLHAQIVSRVQPSRDPNRHARNWNSLLMSLSDLLAELGDIQAASEAARRVESGIHSAAIIGRGAARGGNTETACAWAASLPTTTDRTMARIGIAIGILDHARIGSTPSGAVW